MTWEQAVLWARATPEMAGLVQLCYYDDPIEDAARRFKANEEWGAITGFLPPGPGKRVLELGAGRGIMSWAFASEGCEVIALEPDPSPVVGAGAIGRLSGLTGVPIGVLSGHGEAIPLPDNSIDYAACRAVLHHVSDLPGVCREVFRVLRPGGRFLAIKEHAADTEFELAEFKRDHPLHRHYGGEHAFPVAEYRRALHSAGFRSIREFGHFDHPISSAPQYVEDDIRAGLLRALAARFPVSLANRISQSPQFRQVYRRWLTLRCRIPGRVHSFIATKP